MQYLVPESAQKSHKSDIMITSITDYTGLNSCAQNVKQRQTINQHSIGYCENRLKKNKYMYQKNLKVSSTDDVSDSFES